MTKENKMSEIRIEKVVLSVGGIGDELEKGIKLISFLAGKKAVKTTSKKRIPNFNIRPGLEIGGKVTLRKDFDELLKRLLLAIGNKVKEKQISENSFSFGIEEYIQIPDIEYQRDIGMRGFEVSVSFSRKGKRTKLKKIKKGKYPQKQKVKREEIINFIKNKFKVEVE